MYKIRNTKSILNEWRNFLNKNSLLKEEYDPSTGELTLYHLTGLSKFRKYNPVVNRNYEATIDPETIDYMGDPSDRSSRIMHRLRNQPPKQMSEAEIVSSSLKSLIDYPFTDGTGFTPGKGALYGPALYTCYEFNPDIVHIYGDIVLKFETNINGFLIFFEDVARQIYGKKSDIYGQIELLLKDKIKNETFQNILSDLYEINIDLNKKISDKTALTSEFALKVSKILFKYLSINQIKRYIKGLIFRGERDGPVCVVYNPVYDVDITGLGKVETIIDEETKEVLETNIIWKDNLSAFIDLYKTEDDDYIPTDDISFERMNQLKKENEDIDYFINASSLDEIINRYIELVNDSSTNKKELSNQFFDLFTLEDFFQLDKFMIESISKNLIINESKIQELKYDFDIDETNDDAVIILLKNIPECAVNNKFKEQLVTTFNNIKIYKFLCSQEGNSIIKNIIMKKTKDISILKILCNDPEDFIRLEVAYSTRDIEIYKILCQDKNARIRRILATLTDDEEILSIMCDDTYKDVRMIVVDKTKNIRTLQKLCNDSDNHIRHIANERKKILTANQ